MFLLWIPRWMPSCQLYGTCSIAQNPLLPLHISDVLSGSLNSILHQLLALPETHFPWILCIQDRTILTETVRSWYQRIWRGHILHKRRIQWLSRFCSTSIIRTRIMKRNTIVSKQRWTNFKPCVFSTKRKQGRYMVENDLILHFCFSFIQHQSTIAKFPLRKNDLVPKLFSAPRSHHFRSRALRLQSLNDHWVQSQATFISEDLICYSLISFYGRRWPNICL